MWLWKNIQHQTEGYYMNTIVYQSWRDPACVYTNCSITKKECLTMPFNEILKHQPIKTIIIVEQHWIYKCQYFYVINQNKYGAQVYNYFIRLGGFIYLLLLYTTLYVIKYALSEYPDTLWLSVMNTVWLVRSGVCFLDSTYKVNSIKELINSGS